MLRNLSPSKFVRLLSIPDEFSCSWSVVRVLFLKVQVGGIVQCCFIEFGCFVSIFGIYKASEVLPEFGFEGSNLADGFVCSIFCVEEILSGLHLKSELRMRYEYLWGAPGHILLRYGLRSLLTFIKLLSNFITTNTTINQ